MYPLGGNILRSRLLSIRAVFFTTRTHFQMKRLLRILGVLVLGILIAGVILGLFVKEVSYTTTVNVEAPVEEAWSTFVDVDRMPEWLMSFTHVEQISGDPMSEGSRFRLHFGEGVTLDEAVTEIAPNQLYSFDMETDMFSGSATVSFAEEDGSTQIVQAVNLRGSAFHWRVMLPVVKPMMAKEAMAALDLLKALIETNPSDVQQPDSLASPLGANADSTLAARPS